MTQTRENAVTMRGNGVTLVGPELKVGDSAPDFSLASKDMSTVTLADSSGKTRLLITVPSLDTGTCEKETVEFNKRLADLSDNYIVYVISKDLPFAQTRFCGAKDIKVLQTLSAYKDDSFGKAYGLMMEGNHLLARAIYVIDPSGKVSYAQLVPEVTNEPNYDEVVDALGAKV